MQICLGPLSARLFHHFKLSPRSSPNRSAGRKKETTDKNGRLLLCSSVAVTAWEDDTTIIVKSERDILNSNWTGFNARLVSKDVETINPNHHLLFFFFFFFKIIKWKRTNNKRRCLAPNRSCCREKGNKAQCELFSSLVCVSRIIKLGDWLSRIVLHMAAQRRASLWAPTSQPTRQTHTGPQHRRVTWEDLAAAESRENQDGRTSSSWLLPFFSAPRRVRRWLDFL